ncbi:Lrp/AsnC ligand binding domain-containing protein [Jannaschia sp. S6380]|uniref:Lrp/AsnC ligand binding domain-containing protein n=1 Tax=Jannaschia sp. S6380 TaxID=2926408 RepID=UPI001FF58260|nr:Lrp/AsnC ligand binding domain-containing protein [Jannaschia sp. S6380]MCK0168272.1 Lrp/AsnC ligand binding domain-containing protein [Jannaschia sp. S6380]
MIARLDRMDHRLIRALHADARLSVAALAERIGLSPNATAERMRRLRRDGVITGYTVRLDHDALGLGLIAFVEIKLDRTDGEVFDAFAAAVQNVRGIEECHMVAGGFDYLLKTRHRDMDEYRAFLAEALAALPGVRETRTYVVMEEIRAGGALPV